MQELLLIVALVVIGLLIRRAIRARKNRKASRHPAPPSLPHRTDVTPSRRGRQIPGAGQAQTRLVPPPLPPRPANRRRPVVLGPRGIAPTQFPCCPFDKERNEAGKPQKIFWDGAAQCYYCSRGHRFQRNGKIIIS